MRSSRRVVSMDGSRARALVVVALVVALAWPLRAGHANGTHGAQGVEEAPTRFERFVLSGCSPCVTESYPVATLPIRSVKLPAFPRGGVGSRAGELRVEALRAYELGRPKQALAMRVTLFVAAPGAAAGTELYRLAAGLLDEEEVPAFVSAVTDIAGLAGASPPEGGAESTETSFRGGSVRIGLLRFRGESVAYVQAGDVLALALRPVWEVPTTMFMPPSDLPALVGAIGQLAARLKQLRGA